MNDWMAETVKFCKKVPINRPKDWPELDMNVIESECPNIDAYEFKMIQNNCKDEQTAIKAIKNKRQSDSDFHDFLYGSGKEAKRNKYFRKKMNDVEDDKESRQDRCLWG